MALDRLTKIDGGGISTTSNYRVGIITASKFIGPFDGTGGNFSGVVTATNGVFSGNISAVDGNFSGNVTIGGTLTYEDVTNIDSVGLITARDGIDCNGDLDVDGHTNLDNVNIAGVTTCAQTLHFPDVGGSVSGANAPVAKFGNSSDLIIGHDGADSRIRAAGAGKLILSTANGFRVQNSATNHAIITGTPNSDVSLFHANTKRFETTGQGINVTGHSELDNVNIAGVSTVSTRLNINTVSGTRLAVAGTNYAWRGMFMIKDTTTGSGAQPYMTFWDGSEANDGSNTGLLGRVGHVNGGNTNERYDFWTYRSTTPISLGTNGLERLRILPAGQTLITSNTSGNSISARTVLTSYTPTLQIEGVSKSSTSASLTANINNTVGPSLWFAKTRGTSLGSNTATQSGDELGTIVFNGADGTDIQTMGSYIRGVVDGSVSSNNVPGRLQFHTATGGTMYERLRIDSSGNVTLGTASAAGNKLYFQSTSGAAQYIASGGSNNRNLIIGSSAGQFVNITSAGDVGIGYDSPTVKLHVREAASGASSYDNRYHIIVEDDAEAYLGFYVPDNGYAGIRFSDASGQAGYIDYYFSDDEMHYAATSKHIFKVANVERLRIDPAGNLVLKDHLAQGNSLVNYIQANDVNGNAQYILGQVSTGNQDLYLQQSKNANLRFQTNASTRWKIDGNPGHLLPEVAGAVDIGSTSAEIGNVYIADDKKLQLGSSQDLQIYHTNSGTSWIRHTNSSEYFILEGNQMDFRDYATGVYRARMGTAVQLYYGGNNVKLATTNTGITVTGEVAASQDYPSLKPTLDLNFAGTASLDSRVTFTRLGASASYVGRDGYVKFAAQNEPRFDHDPVTRECKGLLIEEQRQNKIGYSNGWNDGVTTDETKSPDGKFNAIKVTGSESGTTYNEGTSTTGVWSVFLKAGSTNYVQLQGGGVGMNNSNIGPYTKNSVINLSDGTFTVNQQNFTAEQYRDGWWRVSVVYTTGGTYQGTTWSIYCLDSSSPSPDTIDNAEHCYVWGEVYEVGSFITSYIGTESNVKSIRGADECYIDGQDFLDFYNQTEGTMISSHSILSDQIPSTHNLYTYQISPTGATQHAPLRLLDKNGSYGNSLTAASVYNNSAIFLVQDTGNPVTVTGRKYKVAVSIKKDDYDAVFNGGDVVGDSTGDLFTADHISIGYYKPSPQAYLNGHIQRLTYYPFKLTNNQLKTITS